MRNSKIIYASDHKIKDAKLLTTLSILYDEIILLHTRPLKEELEILSEKNSSNILTTDDSEFLYFYNVYLNDLSSEHLIRFMSHAESVEVFDKAKKLEVGDVSFDNHDGGGIKIKFDNGITPVTKDILQYLLSRQERTTVGDFMRILTSFSIAETYKIPVISDSFNLKHNHKLDSSKEKIDIVSQYLAILAIGELVFPEFYASNGQDILKAKQKLSNELIEFRAAILDLTYLVSQKTYNKNDVIDYRRECSELVNTKIKSALTLLERRIGEFNRNRILNLTMLGTKIILNLANFFTAGLNVSDAFSSGVGSIDALDQLNKLESPTNSVATFLVQMKQEV